MSWELIKKAIEDQATGFEEFKKTNDARLKAIADGNDTRAKELDAKLAKIDTDLTGFGKLKKEIEIEMQFQKERMEELETRSKQPGKTEAEKNRDEYKAHWLKWMRNKGQDTESEIKMQAIQKKDVTIGTASAGGHAVPEEISREIENLELKFSPVRRLVKVVKAGTSDYKELVSYGNAVTSGWIGETGSRPATATPQLREVVPTHGEIYAYPQVSEWSLDDMFFNVEGWLTENVAENFAIAEATAVISGNGTSKPTGMLNSAPTAVADGNSPMRAAAVYEFVASAGSPLTRINPDRMIDLIYKLNSAYRSGAVWAMNSVTTGQVRRLKDTTGQYLWQPSLVAGQPEQLLGYPVETWEQLADPAVNALPIAFGNFRRGYVLVDRVGLRITRDNVTNIGFVRFYVRRRESGIVLNNDAIKWLKTT